MGGGERERERGRDDYMQNEGQVVKGETGPMIPFQSTSSVTSGSPARPTSQWSTVSPNAAALGWRHYLWTSETLIPVTVVEKASLMFKLLRE